MRGEWSENGERKSGRSITEGKYRMMKGKLKKGRMKLVEVLVREENC